MMKKHRYGASVVIGLIKGLLVASIIIFNAMPFSDVNIYTGDFVDQIHASGLSSEFGVIDAIPSLQGDSSKQSATAKVTGAGFGWIRHEYTFATSIDFTPYDEAYTKSSAAGLKILGLLTYPGSSYSHDDWKTYVNTVVGHYGSGVAAWEIMNEADNYLSASDYVSYLSEANTIIKSINSSAKIVCTGITSRIEATNFWDGVAAAGGWGLFDEIGLHVYHDGNPEKVNFGGGDLVGELDRVAGNINKNGGGKNIWITEMGYQSGSVGSDNQANWLARSLVMLRSVSKVEKVFIYRLYDTSNDSYGLLTSGLAEKTSYSKVKDAVANLSGAGTGTKLTPQTKTTLDGFDSVSSSWSTKGTSNGTTSLSSTSGYSGNGMKISYNFSADSAYAIAERKIDISGTPTAIAAWFYGDDTKNVWKFRFTDKNGETFQTDLGSISAGWSYKQFSIGTDTAWVSWGGNGNIDFPISFNSFVIDRQGGSASANGIVDELIAISGSADLYAYQFGDDVAYWKASGSDNATLCGATRQFTESPQFAGGVNCSDTPSSSTGSSTSSSSKSKSKKSTTTTVKTPISLDKTYVRLDGEKIPADGSSTYRIVVGVKDANGNFLTDRKPSILMSGGQTVVADSVLVGSEWFTLISSTEPGDRTAIVKVDDQTIKQLTLTYVAVAAAVSPPTISAEPVEANTNKINAAAIGIATGSGALALAGLGFWQREALLRLFWLIFRRKKIE